MHRKSQKKICLVTDELAGPDYNGGIGTANQGLALTLAAAGYSVDVLYTRVAHDAVQCTVGTFPDHVERFLNRGVRLLTIAHSGAWHDYAAKSFAALHHLQSVDYDLVFFNDTHGTGFYPLLSRRTGNARLADMPMCVVTHSATQWIADLNGEPVTRIETLRLFEMERQSIELADIVFSPSSHLIGKYKEYGWMFPAETHVRRNIMPGEWRSKDHSSAERRPIDELVFFGRLERRKGIDLFCAALDRLKFRLRGKRVSFLGKDTVVNGTSNLESVVKRSSAWPFEVQIMTDFNRERALSYLQNGNRLAIMPSPEENSPCAIQECLELGIPFIASSGSGGEELIAPRSRERCCFVPTVPGLVRKLEEILEKGAYRGDPSFDPEENKRSLLDWLSNCLSQSAGRSSSAGSLPRADETVVAPPLTVIVVAHEESDQSAVASQVAMLESALGTQVRLAMVPPLETGATPAPNGNASRRLTPTNYQSFVDSIPTEAGSYVCIWDASLELNTAWLLRAKGYLERERECIGVTGLATTGAAVPLKEPPPYMSLLSASPTLREAIVGATAPLALLSQDSNSGFVLLPAAAFRAMSHCPPWDSVYARAKDAEEWIDELLRELVSRGGKTTLLPDAPVSPRRSRTWFEVFRKGAARRSTLARSPNHRPGSASALLSAFGIDRLADAEAGQGALSFLQGIAEYTKLQPQEWLSGGGVSNAYLEKVAIAAFSTGQVALSKEILAYLTSLNGAASSALAQVERFWEDDLRGPLCLAKLVDAGSTQRSADVIRSNIAIEGDDTAIQFPVSRFESGRGVITFRLDLTDFTSFSSSLRTRGPEGQQLWFYAGLTSLNGQGKIGFEGTAAGRSETRVDFTLPEELRRPCTFDLIVERRGEVVSGAEVTAIWRNPQFRRGTADQYSHRHLQ